MKALVALREWAVASWTEGCLKGGATHTIMNTLDENTQTTLGIVGPSSKIENVWIVRSIKDESWLLADGTFTSELPLQGVRAAAPVVIELFKSAHVPRFRPVRIRRLESLDDLRLLKLCFFDHKYTVWEPVARPFLQRLHSKAKIEAILTKLQQPGTSFTAPFALTLVTDAELVLPAFAQLRKHISHEQRWQVLSEGLRLGLEEPSLEVLINEVPSNQQIAFWSVRPKSAKLTSKLLSLRPPNVQLIEDFPDVSSIGNPAYQDILTTVEYFLKKLDAQDRSLAQLWMKAEPSTENQDFVEAKMLSARMAEKVAASFLRQLKFRSVIDIAVQQLSNGQDWKTHDLLVEGKIPVDVKNARLPVNGHNSYAEYTVPRFKLDRDSEEVRILGVLSPYLFLNEFEKGEIYRPEKKQSSDKRRIPPNIQVLGVIKPSTVRQLESAFGTRILHLQILSSSEDDSRGQPRQVMPPWVFDYPDKYYQQVNATLDKISRLTGEQIPSGSLIAKTGKNAPIAVFLAACKRPPDDWMADLKDWEMDFIDYLLSHLQSFKKPILPVVFLAILSHFTKMVSSRISGEYDPLSYGRIVNWGGTPLGRRDPLNLVAGLCQNLSTAWNHRDLIQLQEFGYFEYKGLGILRGARSHEDRLTTLLSYCGGYIEGKGKCGYPDLVLGKDNISPCKRGYLICPVCGYCCAWCQANIDKHESWNIERSYSSKYYDLASPMLPKVNAWGIDGFSYTGGDSLIDVPF